MILLALETTAAQASCALLRDGKTEAVLCCDAGLRHAESLLPTVERLLSETGTPKNALDAVAVDVGPGSFTGVRIGVTTANGLGYALGIPVIAVDSLRVLYEPFAGMPERVCAMIDARNGNCYAAVYENGLCVTEPVAGVTAEVAAMQRQGTRYTGDTAWAPEKTYPDAASLAAAAYKVWEREKPAPDAQARPLYLRPSQAERLAKEK